MFDISYGPWLICALVGIIILRPDEWLEVAFKGGKFFRMIRAYIMEWQEYMDCGTKVSAPSQSMTPKGEPTVWPESLDKHQHICVNYL